MGLSLLLSLLLLPTCLQADSSEECDSDPDYHQVNQPKYLSAPMGGSVHINFSFYYCWELAKNSRVSVALRRTQFHGEFIYNSTWPSFHKDYKNRISLNLPKGQKSGSLQISNLRKEDENIYFCRVQVETREDGKKVWQARQGTKLTITHGESSCPGSHHAHPAEALKGHGALIPQAWPRPQSSSSLLLSNSSPHTHLLPRPLPTLLFLLHLPRPGLPSSPIPFQAPTPLPGLSTFWAPQLASLLAPSWGSSPASLPSSHAILVDLTSSGCGLPSLCHVSACAAPANPESCISPQPWAQPSTHSRYPVMTREPRFPGNTPLPVFPISPLPSPALFLRTRPTMLPAQPQPSSPFPSPSSPASILLTLLAPPSLLPTSACTVPIVHSDLAPPCWL
ncbi:paired immunoglobulin-like type 2 receptor alpha isoform X1 [Ursus maritimus]|uniref:paired immunoglobulin-like type 2 receptor alpha isoform X1 n=1 Tax=Ursus maritimus TaxID=29073 RepID=UPI001AE0C185|nr:paired immunoglobulin-like type 2 receptor alpha isoform X1 [Ursus maritimus]